MHQLDWTGRTVLVLGGSSGIGNGIAQTFLEHRARVVVCGTRPSAVDYAGEEGSNLSGLEYVRLDVSSDEAVRAFVPPFEQLDVLVCAQGTVMYKGAEFQMPGFRRVLDVNLMSVMACCLKFQPLLAQTRGSIIVLSSGGAFKATRGNPGYSASKGGLRLLTMTLGEAWARDGIRVNGIAPGYVDTKLTKVTRNHARRYEETLKEIPMGRWGTPEEMGGVALFLASPLSSYVTGQTIIADGGKILS